MIERKIVLTQTNNENRHHARKGQEIRERQKKEIRYFLGALQKIPILKTAMNSY